MPLLTSSGMANMTPAPGTAVPSRKIGAASSRSPRAASNRSRLRSLASLSRLIEISLSCSAGSFSMRKIPSSSLPLVCITEVFVDGAILDFSFVESDVVCSASESSSVVGSGRAIVSGLAEGPTCFRMAFSVTPRRRAISQLLSPCAFSRSMTRRRLVGMRRRPGHQPERVASAGMPPSA